MIWNFALAIVFWKNFPSSCIHPAWCITGGCWCNTLAPKARHLAPKSCLVNKQVKPSQHCLSNKANKQPISSKSFLVNKQVKLLQHCLSNKEDKQAISLCKGYASNGMFLLYLIVTFLL
jgi:hypothetical protein